MDPKSLIPVPDTIPAHWGVFEFLDLLTFLLHILVINVVVGGTIIMFFSRLRGNNEPIQSSFFGGLVHKIPTSLALGINFGVAPLLFIQVLYGHFLYTSSVLMATFWILIIPLLIIAYYGTYMHSYKYETNRILSITALGVSLAIFLYIAFIFVNNMTLMLHPDKWQAYFEARDGLILNLGDPMLLPRYLHFLTASVAIAGLFTAIIWHLRRKKQSEAAEAKIRTGLKIFGWATIIQVLVGCWFLLAQPREIMMLYMGQGMLHTILMTLGILTALMSIYFAFKGKLFLTLYHLLAIIVFMIGIRALLRSAYLSRYFSLSELSLTPQYSVLILFLVVFIIGLVSVNYMVRAAVKADERRASA